jgi:Spy/CpxP family protein refolding chaperone
MLGRVILALLLAAGLASAQRGGRGGGGSRGVDPGGDFPMMAAGQHQSRLDKIAGQLKLNKEQRPQVETILSAAQEEATPVMDKILKVRVAVVNAIVAGRSQEEIDKMMTFYTAASAEMTSIEAKAFSKIFATLKPNQQSKAVPAFEQFAGIFMARDWRRVR